MGRMYENSRNQSQWVPKTSDCLHVYTCTQFTKNVEDTEWVDADMKQAAPPVMKDVKVKHYVNGVKQVLAVSPDYQEGIMKEISFEIGTDGNGDYVEFELPYLEYYTMIVFEK